MRIFTHSLAFLLLGLAPVISETNSTVARYAAKPITNATVLVNQVGYDSRAPKSFVFQTPTNQSCAQVTFHVLDAAKQSVFAGTAQPAGLLWGVNYWTGDFSSVQAPGRFVVEVITENGTHQSFPFLIGDDVIFRETAMMAEHWFRLQRCGDHVDGWHEACHLDDAVLTNNGVRVHLDTTGGWHDAGDWNKYSLITCRSVYALTELARNQNTGLSDADRKKVRAEALWGGEFLRKMWQPGKGKVYQDVWFGYGHRMRPDLTTDNVIGTGDDRTLRSESYSGMVAAALAALAHETGRKDFREAAIDLWRGAEAHLDEDTEEIWNGWEGQHTADLGQDVKGRYVRRVADLLLADIELEQLTGESRYAESAKRLVKILQDEQGPDGLWPTDGYSRMVLQGVPAAALALYCKTAPKTGAATIALAVLRKWTEGLKELSNSPFGIVPFAKGVFFCPRFKAPQGAKNAYYVWGQNSQYLSDAWALYQAAQLLNDPAARRLADRQMDWVLGLNKLNLCMMEGRGSYNPPQWLHSWGMDHMAGTVPGAVANGITRPKDNPPSADEPWYDFADFSGRPYKLDYTTTESWEPHSAFFILSVTARSALNHGL